MKRSDVRLHDSAQAEIIEAHRWYWRRSESAADNFLLELEHALDEIAEHPDTWPAYRRGTRCFAVRRFPFLIIYRRKGRGLQVVAVAHTKRRPGYWTKRLH